MPANPDQLTELRAVCPGAKVVEEGGIEYVFLPDLVLPEGCQPARADVLLRFQPRDGYNSRLFFSSQIAPVRRVTTDALNWNANSVGMFERTWFAFSWRTVEGLSLAQMLTTHLKGLR